MQAYDMLLEQLYCLLSRDVAPACDKVFHLGEAIYKDKDHIVSTLGFDVGCTLINLS
jgi:hypothetical protein